MNLKRPILVLSLIFTLISLLPVAAQSTLGIYSTAQRFEHGFMIWRSDSAFIWVLGDNGQVFNFPATAYSSLPDNPIFGTSSSRLRPIFGFGKVWGNNRSVRDLLGWPTLPEIGFSMPIQYTNRTYYLTQLDGTIIQINANNTWTRTTGSPTPIVSILSFSATPNPVAPGGTLTFSWSVQGTQYALLEVYDVGSNTPHTQLLDLPLTGSAPVTIPATTTTGVRAVLYAANKARGTTIVTYGREAQQEIIIGMETSAVTNVTTQAAFQQYQHGFMIWRGDTGTIYTFFDTARWSQIPQRDYENLPDNPIQPAPNGYVLPINGFGRVWGNNQGLRDALGWATTSEQGYQITIRSLSGEPVAFTLPDARTVAITDTWRRFWGFQ